MPTTTRYAIVSQPAIGDLVQDRIGHWYQIVAILSPYQYRVQALTPAGASLVPIGVPCIVGRSDLRIDQ